VLTKAKDGILSKEKDSGLNFFTLAKNNNIPMEATLWKNKTAPHVIEVLKSEQLSQRARIYFSTLYGHLSKKKMEKEFLSLVEGVEQEQLNKAQGKVRGLVIESNIS
jgi:hypothetical protein